ncbi:MAG: GtrA family protein [Candidatus Saccharimonadales bacterium]
MDYLSDLSKNLYRHKFIRYLFVGGTTFIIDLGLLSILKIEFKVNIALATSVAYWVSIIYNFFLNRWWSFSITEKTNLSRHAVTYGILLGFNYLFTVIFVSIGSHYMSFIIAKVIVVLISMTWTYYIYKNYIFTKKEPLDTISDTRVTNSKA